MSDLRQWIEKQIGKSFTALMEEKSGSRLVGLIQRRGPEWRKAFEHIRLHFGPVTVPDKDQHTIFVRKYCTEEALAALLADAAAHLSHRPIVAREIHNKIKVGDPSIVLQRWFGRMIGYSNEQAYRKDVPDAPYLRIIMTYRGELTSAYPAKSLQLF